MTSRPKAVRAVITVRQRVMKHVTIVRQDAREQSVIKFSHQISHSRAATSIEAKSNSTSYERFKTLFVWYCREARPRWRGIQYLCDYHRLEDDLQRVFTHTMASKNFHRVQRLSTLANDVASAPSLAVFRERLQTFLFSRSYQDTIIWLVCYYHHSSLLSGHLWSLQ